jgi:ribosomal protein S10
MVGPVGLPTKTKRWTVLKSVFKYKKFQESFEMIIYNQKLTIDTDTETADKFLAYVTGTINGPAVINNNSTLIRHAMAWR